MQEDGFDLGAYLEQARAAGTRDSEGSFTLEQERSLKKLAKFNLPHPYDWVSKIVQAANAFECDQLIIKQQREASSFYFRPAGENFPEDESLITALKTGTYDKGGPVDTLSIALRALVDQLGLSFVLATRRRETIGKPIFSGHDTSGLSDSKRERWSEMSEQGLRLTVSHFTKGESITGRYLPSLTQNERRDLPIAERLIGGSYASSTDVYLDGLRVSDPCLHSDYGAGRGGRPVAFGTVTRDPDGSLQVAATFLNPQAHSKHLRKSNLACARATSWFYLRSGDWLFLPEFQDGRYKLESWVKVNWVRHGVVVSTAKVKVPTIASSLQIFVNADDYRSDLSGLAIEVTEEAESEAKELALTITRYLQGLPSRMREFVESPPSVEAAPSGENILKDAVELGDTDTGLTENLIEVNLAGWSRARKELGESWRRLLLSFSLTARLSAWTHFLESEIRVMGQWLAQGSDFSARDSER